MSNDHGVTSFTPLADRKCRCERCFNDLLAEVERLRAVLQSVYDATGNPIHLPTMLNARDAAGVVLGGGLGPPQ